MLRRLVVMFTASVLYLVWFASAALAFPDVGATHPYRTAIENLSSRGIISGYQDGRFGPQDAVMRAQFAKLVCGALQVPVPAEGSAVPFSDLGSNDPTSLYPHEYVAAAAQYNITRGTGQGRFSPWENISRAQVVTMVVRAADSLQWCELPDPPAGYQSQLGAFDATHGPAMAKAQFHGLLSGLAGYGPTWNAWQTMNRGEVAQVLYNLVRLKEEGPPAGDVVPVVRVTDGDTIGVIYQGRDEAVRLIGFDAPETGRPFAAEAKSYLQQLVGGKQVRLEFDSEQRDRYGRLLAYVWLGSTLVNAELLRAGLATIYTVAPNTRYTTLLAAAENEARQAGRGLWAAPAGSPLEIVRLQYDAPGNDNFNLNEEWIEFRVLRAGSLAGYAVEDESGHRYYFPERAFQAGQVFKLRTGQGSDTQTDLYWGASGSAIWNNNGDTVKVLDSQGHVVLSRTY